LLLFFFSSRRRHTRFSRDWSSDVCSSDLASFRPAINNELSLGSSLARWTTVYATNGTINTSDRNLKTNILPISYGLSVVNAIKRSEERRVGKECRSRWSR